MRSNALLRHVLVSSLLVAAAILFAGVRAPQASQQGQQPFGDEFQALRYRFIGPPGNRVSAVVGEPGNWNVYYAGAASGGVWKSTDGGINWQPVFDGEPAMSIGSLAVAPSNDQIVWAGTGETFIRSNVSVGDGIYKSVDAGRTWTHMGLDRTGRIGRIVIDPRNPDIVFAAALGHCYGPQQERGVYRTRDGGRTWERVLFVDENTGASDIAIDPENPQVIFAGMWQIDIKTWGRESGNPGSGVFVTRDGGDTWHRITGHGLPSPPLGKIAVAIAPSMPDRVYALIETGQRGTLWRSDDGGINWQVVNYSRLLNERPHYYTRMLVMPDDANQVYFPSNGMAVTYDGGETTQSVPWGGDNHDMWVDPTSSSRMMIGNDLGVMITTTHGRQWSWLRLPIGQMYHVATDNDVPYNVYGNMQDYASVRGPSNSRVGGSISPALWTTVGGCESGWAIPDPEDSNIVWSGCYAGVTERFDLRTHQARTVSVWPERSMGAPAGILKYRMNWTYPIAISPFDHNKVYVGAQYVMQTTDGGQTWTAISPDLTRNDKSKMGDSGGLTIDNLSVEYIGVIWALEESPIERGLIWTGSNDGLVQLTRDGGRTWTNVTPNIPNLPPWGTVSSVDPSKYDAGTCYVTVDFHQVGDFDPFVYKTNDYGKTWKSISSNIPRTPFSYVRVVREDPVRRGLLYLGTENSLFVSFDDGRIWQPLQNDLPHAPVYWLTVQENFKDLVVGTYGRGYYILDDVTPLEQMTDQVRSQAVHLFEMRPAYRFRTVERRDLAPSGTSAGRNPPYGASINYMLKAPVKGAVQLTILDPQGQVVRRVAGTNSAGVNRVWWDLRWEGPDSPRLRTTPEGNPHVWEEKRFRGREWRPVYYYGIETARVGPLVVPGTYTVRLEAGGQTLTGKLEVRKDPNTAGTLADIQAQTRLLLDIRRNINTVVGMINEIEWARRQIEDLGKRLAGDGSAADVLKAAGALNVRMQAVEDRLLQKTLAEGDQKSFRGPIQLYLKLVWLSAEIGTGGADVAGGADFEPTAAELQVHEELVRQLSEVQAQYETLVTKDVPQFNRTLVARNLEGIVLRAESGKR